MQLRNVLINASKVHNLSFCVVTYRKLVVSTFPEDEIVNFFSYLFTGLFGDYIKISEMYISLEIY